MSYISTYFNVKIGAIGKLIGLIKDAWKNKIWLAVILATLWALFCIVGGMLLFPIDFIWGAFMWRNRPDLREAMEELVDELAVE